MDAPASDLATQGYLLGSLLLLWQNTNVWALLIAVLTPALIIFGRQEIRMRRVRQIFDFERTFERIVRPGGNRPPNPSFEFVRSKYLSDIDLDGPFGAPGQQLPSGSQFEVTLDRIRRQGRRRDLGLLASCVALMILTYLGIDALLAAVSCGFQGVSCPCSQASFCSVAAGRPGSGLASYGHLVVIASLAFAGAYVETVRTLLRHLAVFDLSSFTFLRQAAEMIAAVVFATIAFAAIPNPLAPFSEPTGADRISPIWIALAPVLGLTPRSATQFVLAKTKNLIAWFKTEDDRFQHVTRVTTIDVIDGIDFPTRFRLENCGIYDVQNLATANPIMLHIETPYGIYQCIDWVAQAQLCHILGIEKFLLMRELNIRTIFDLERAIDSREGPDAIDTIYAGILFAATDNLRSISTIGKAQPMIVSGDTVSPVSVDDYCLWARGVIGTNPEQATKCIEHVMRWIGDDLHVRRLRLVWNDISETLGKDAESLKDSKTRPAQ